MESWLFQANPKFYRVRPALHHFKGTSQLTTWLVNAHKTKIKADDEVFFWEAAASGIGRLGKNPNGASQNPLGAGRMAVRDFEGKI